MALDADTMVERRRLRRKLSFWRIFAFVIAVIAILAVAGIGAKDSFGEQIARVPITGVISDDWSQREFLRKLGETERVKAVILAINSPGGTTAGGEALYEAIRKLSGKKPVVATIGTVGASAAYLAAIAADRVIARETSITGSVGVLFQWANFKELADKVGVDMRVVKSDPLKAEPSPFNEDTPEETRVLADRGFPQVVPRAPCRAPRHDGGGGARAGQWPYLFRPPRSGPEDHRRHWRGRNRQGVAGFRAWHQRGCGDCRVDGQQHLRRVRPERAPFCAVGADRWPAEAGNAHRGACFR